MKISVFGLGYVGSVSAACLAGRGHYVIGVDPNVTKVDLMKAGAAPIVEEGLEELSRDAVAKGLMTATVNAEEAVLNTDLSIICVATPSLTNGSLNFAYLRKVCSEIGAAMAKKDSFHVVVVRSTILPGTLKNIVIPILEESSGKKVVDGFGVCNNPEFLREGTAIYDFMNPPKTVIGQSDERSGDMVQSLYEGLPGPMIRCPVEVGEMVKYADNCWHAVKVSFANEIGNICKLAGIDSHKVMEIFCQDTKLNLSPYYMKPGFSFGGSCLPKDLRALIYKAHAMDLKVPLLAASLETNKLQTELGIERIMKTGKRKIGFLGFSFKAGTDDLRESPLVDVIERLIGKGYDLRLYDRNVNIARLTGANRDYILNVIPHISKLMASSMDEVLAHAEVIVIGNGASEFAEATKKLRPEQHVIDLVRIKGVEDGHANYDGLCW